MSKVISICTQKGGVAKTTSTANLGVALARQGNRVLLVDFDPQADLTICFGYTNPDALDVTMLICEIKGEEIGVVLELQDATKSHKVISFLADRKEELEQKPEKEDTVTENYTFGGYYEEQ